jgi:alpha-glucosidase (family GH31 glycosyl hydrolase)
MGPPRQYTNEAVAGPLTMMVFPGASGVSSLYEDDGESFNYRKGEFMRIEMHWEDTARKLAIRLAPGATMLRANPLELSIKVADSSQSKNIVFTGDPLSATM